MKLFTMPALMLARKIHEGSLTAPEVAEAFLGRVKELDPKIGAFLLTDRAWTLEAAERAQRRIDALKAEGKPVPPLAGVPVALKDNLCTRGIATTCASRILEHFKPPYDATAVERLFESLMVPLGKCNMDEFAMGSSTEYSAFGPTRNPWDPSRVPGGSSGGSAAAVAARMAPLALGTDTGGSIRQPASFCGVTGLKPTYGAVSRFGAVAYASSLDQIGPIGRTAADCAALFEVVRGRDERDATSADIDQPACLRDIGAPLDGMKIGVPSQYMGEGIAPAVRQAVEAALSRFRELGCSVTEVSIPALDYALPAYYILSCAEAGSNLSRFDGVRYGYRAQGAGDIDELYTRTRSEGFGAEVKRRILLGTYVLCAGYYDEYYKKALRMRSLVKAGYEKALGSADILMTPTAPIPAFGIGEKVDELSMCLADICTVSVNIAGLPAISFPCGFTGGLPVGLQAIGRPFGEATLLRAAHAYQQVTDWHVRVPAVSEGGRA
ncbi:MAG: Asp-tRNA(Asn)/Glu-tRNA(Gln) amidotransferase subunit GatA [Christensenellales bacterium]